MSNDSPGSTEILDQAQGPDGETLVLRRAQGGFEIVEYGPADAGGPLEQGGKVIMASALRRSERELINVGLVPLRDRNDITVLVGGLGMGHVLAALLESPRIVRVDVVEHAAPIIQWNRTHLSVLHREPPLADERVHIHNQGFSDFLRAMRYGAVQDLQLDGDGFLAVLLDMDDGPSVLRRTANAALYSDDGFEDIETALRPGGVIALWSAQRETELLKRIQARFQNLAEIAVPVDVPESAGLDYIYRARKRPPVAPAGNRPRAQA
jgi:spermidine synthase